MFAACGGYASALVPPSWISGNRNSLFVSLLLLRGGCTGKWSIKVSTKAGTSSKL